MFIFSFLWGLGIAVLLMRKCMDGYCVVVQGPKKEEIKDNIFKVDGKCYTFEPKLAKCEKTKEMIKTGF